MTAPNLSANGVGGMRGAVEAKESVGNDAARALLLRRPMGPRGGVGRHLPVGARALLLETRAAWWPRRTALVAFDRRGREGVAAFLRAVRGDGTPAQENKAGAAAAVAEEAEVIVVPPPVVVVVVVVVVVGLYASRGAGRGDARGLSLRALWTRRAHAGRGRQGFRPPGCAVGRRVGSESRKRPL